MCIWIQRKPIQLDRNIAALIQEDWRTDYKDYGSIEGAIEVIQDGAALQIKVRDLLYKNPIKCYISNNLLDQALKNFRKRVELSGLIHYRKNGTPISIDVTGLTTLPDDSDLPEASDVRGILKVVG